MVAYQATEMCICLETDFAVLFQSAHAANEAFELAATYNLENTQVFAAMFLSLVAGILATRLATELYK